MSNVSHIPPKCHTINAYLIVPNCVEAIEFYQKALGAEVGYRMPGPDGESTMHAEMTLGDSTFMLTDENEQWNLKSPKTLGGCTTSLHLYVENTDKLFEQAVAAGCTVMAPPADMFWGDRFAKVADPFGHHWSIATHLEDLPLEEINRRAAEFFANMGDAQ